ncbi:HNH endonuclease [Colwellia hornerae]|uniref:HNH endonuclease n=1 Tax=Colwellia hornerae TaxID=89402 RepID=A0A5C6QC57_9GAMM|nr:HNH endonuclease signature motif containing protein [Colwellia hornerae]TWX55201.1 HNH endonuclease [Colwellia hornerae]TWX61201.1 HNH endonuclease [Colwellia hornerae]TWX66449.1 HNH endonuclease [Colwellia hornerae]
MRKIDKLPKPQILIDNETPWLIAFKADKSNATKKYRYRHADIKTTLRSETNDKCVYCESKVGHNTPGDIEHKIPSSKVEDLHFSWENLTIACTECNRRKNDYYEVGTEFLDPNIDYVEDFIEHHGPITTWKAGSQRAEVSIRILKLNSKERLPLIINKIEKIEEVNNLVERYESQQNSMLKKLLEKQLLELASKASEYSGMVLEMLVKKGIPV